jgi:hypothetical protein
MDVKAVKERRKQFADKFKRNTDIWKAPKGTHDVRVVPYINNSADPFEELWWHWNIGNRGFLCLKKNKGEDCPICNMASEMWKSEEDEDKEIAKKMFANVRFYAPVLPRDAEEEGVKWWGLSQTLYDALTSEVLLDQVGDYTDIEAGRDIAVTFKTKEETGNDYGKVSVDVKFTTSPLSEDKEVVAKSLKEQPSLIEMYPYNTADELTEVLRKWLFPEDAEEEAASKPAAKSAPKEKVESLKTESEDDSAGTDESLENKFKKLLD